VFGSHLLLAAGLRSFTFFSAGRSGPALEVEVGSLGERHHWGLFFRPYFGDRTGYALGGRVEGGPRLGPIRLCFGIGMSLLLIPDTDDPIDLLGFHLQLAGALWRWKHLVIQADAFTLDLNLVPANSSLGREVEVRMGFGAGLSVGAWF